MSNTGPKRLSQEEIHQHLSQRPDWGLKDGLLTRTYAFPTYKDGLVFAVAVGQLADRLNHHPDLFIGYQKVTIGLTTHDLGGISTLDFDLAEQIDGLG